MFSEMSCLMYQPYASYFPYQRTGAATSAYPDPIKKFHASFDKVHDGLHASSYPTSLGLSSNTTHAHAHTLSSAGALSSLVTKEEQIDDKESQPKDTQYLSANCVILSYVTGDTASNVDEHFSRSLSQSNNHSAITSDSQGSLKSSSDWKSSGGVPMSQRNFPPSFWNSHWQPPPPPPASNTLAGLADPYSHMTSSLHSMSSFTQDPWRYPFSSQGHSYSHPSLHDLSYGAASNRFNSQFSSLMPTASKLSSLTGQYDLTKHAAATDAWAASSRYHTDPFGPSTSLQTSHQDPYGLYSGALSGTC